MIFPEYFVDLLGYNENIRNIVMFTVTETASNELKKVFETEENSEKSLILYFMGAG